MKVVSHFTKMTSWFVYESCESLHKDDICHQFVGINHYLCVNKFKYNLKQKKKKNAYKHQEN